MCKMADMTNTTTPETTITRTYEGLVAAFLKVRPGRTRYTESRTMTQAEAEEAAVAVMACSDRMIAIAREVLA